MSNVSVFRLCTSGNNNLPRLDIVNGTVEVLKWLALLLMTGDHINKYLYNVTLSGLSEAGRLAMPIFTFVFAFNLARPDTLKKGVYQRVILRLVVIGAISSIPYIALGGVKYGWWPLNIMFTLLVSTRPRQRPWMRMYKKRTSFFCAA